MIDPSNSKTRSKGGALLQYLGTSFIWLILMALWVLIIGPYMDGRCHTSASFGFLPAAIVVPFLVLLLYAISVAVHAVFAFSKRADARARSGTMLLDLDAMFFVPFAVLSLIALMASTHWGSALHCFLMTIAIALPWIVTPIVNSRLLAWTT